MDEYENNEKHNLLTWYRDATREDISTALRTDWEKFVGLLIKYDPWIQTINTQLELERCEDITL